MQRIQTRTPKDKHQLCLHPFASLQELHESLARNNLKTLCCSHQMVEDGFEFLFEERLLTLLSASTAYNAREFARLQSHDNRPQDVSRESALCK